MTTFLRRLPSPVLWLGVGLSLVSVVLIGAVTYAVIKYGMPE